MELIHKFLNIAAPIFTFFCLCSVLPLLYFYRLLKSLYGAVFSESLRGKVVLITGASSGIGEHLAYEYASRGACLALAARRKNKLQQVADISRELGSPDVITIQADVSRTEDCKSAVDETTKHFGRLDHLVTNAGITPVCMFEVIPDITDFRTAMDTNFWGSVDTTRFAIPHLVESRGKIVAVCSAASWLTAPRMSLYNASKAAMLTFFETLRIELGNKISITIVTPGLTESEMTQGKFFTGEGKMTVDQDLRDVQIGPVPVRSVSSSAKAIVNGACRGERYLTEPRWYRVTYLWKVFCPEVVDWMCGLLYLTSEGTPAKEALNKKILDVPGVRKLLYPETVLTPERKTD